MKKRKIYVTEADKTRLKKLYSTTVGFRQRDLKTVKDLLNELERAEVITNGNVDNSVITMNSTVIVQDLDTREYYTYTIVYPETADSSKNMISILAPIGTALLGYKTGDTVEWEVPAGKRKLYVKAVVYQPENERNILAESESG